MPAVRRTVEAASRGAASRGAALRGAALRAKSLPGPHLRQPALAAVLVALCVTLACTGPVRRPVDRPAPTLTSPADPAVEDGVGDAAEDSVELDGVVAHATVSPIGDAAETADAPDVRPRGPLMLRVGLATDLERVRLPCCDGRFRLVLPDGSAGDGLIPLDRRVVVAPSAEIRQKATYRLQVAALKDEGQAEGIARYLRDSTDEPAEAVFDADTDLYRVRVGRFGDREAAEAARGSLAGLGVTEGWVVSEGGELEDAAFVVRSAGAEPRTVEGRWLEIRADREGDADLGIPFAGSRYRGRLLIFLNDRGLLNVINELPLEQYLRGVVPKEMGPELYDELEALKAQTVAARTYTLRNLGEFAEEGYDICSTPRCQVYGGVGVEHPVSDRAIRETEGQVVLFDGRPAQTLYSATCGGHTEDVEVVFPLKSGDYLRGVPCLESGVTTVKGGGPAGRPFPDALVDRLLPASPGADARSSLSSRLEHLALLADLPVPEDRLRSLERDEVMRYLGSLFDLTLDRRLVASRGRVAALLSDPPTDWTTRDRRFADYLVKSGLLPGPGPVGGDVLPEVEIPHLLFELSLYLGVLDEESLYFLEIRDGVLHVREDGHRPALELPERFGTFRRTGRELRTAPLELMAGDPLLVYSRGPGPGRRDGPEGGDGPILALVQPVDAPDVHFGRRAPKQRWTLWKSDAELRRAVQERYPGFPFAHFEVVERGRSGRVGKLELVGEDGRRVLVEGLAVRWTLDVPDTLFHAERHVTEDGRRGWIFRGRGWGHGVGMSQAGAFGMAVRGATYREILEHYYTGVHLGRLKPAPPRPRLPLG